MKFTLTSALFLALASHCALAVPLYRNGGASKAYNKVRTPQDYDAPDASGTVPANANKGMSTNSDRNSLPSPNKNVWSIDSTKLDTGALHPVNDHDTHWAITLLTPTNIDTLLDDINNAGWTKLA